MATNDLSNKEQMLYDYLKELLKANFPNLDLSDTGAFMETFGLTHLKLLSPLFSFADRITLMQSIENAALMTEDEMDQVASRYFFTRQAGNRASGYVTLVFKDVPPTNILSIPAGQVALSKQGLKYLSTNNVLIDETQLGNYYDSSTFRFRVPLAVQADSVGAVYNVDPGEINQIQTPLPYLETVINDAALAGGTDRESNIDFAKRIQSGANASSLGTNRGYARFLKDNFIDVQDVLVAGFGHPLMKRDIIGVAPPDKFNQTARDIHWGTKVDLYVRGNTLSAFAEYQQVVAIPDTSEIGIRLTKTPVFDVQQVSLTSSDPNVSPAQLLITQFTLTKDEDPETIGTLYENAWVVINDNRVSVGTTIQVSYRYNALVQNITTRLYTQEDRPPTADVLVKEAHRRYVFGSMIVKQLGTLRLRDVDKSAIRQRAADFIGGIGMGAQIQYSDVADAIMSADPTNPLVDYISLPAQFLLLPNNSKYIYYCLSEQARAILDSIAASKSYAQTMLNTYKDTITVYDFFDCLHMLIYDNGLDDASSGIANLSLDWNNRLNRFMVARDVVAKGKMISFLSPAKSTLNAQEYFETGPLSVYEDQVYTQTDWTNLMTLLDSLSAVPTNSDHTNDSFCLVSYLLTIVYLAINEAKLITNQIPYYLYMQSALLNTPAQGKFD